MMRVPEPPRRPGRTYRPRQGRFRGGGLRRGLTVLAALAVASTGSALGGQTSDDALSHRVPSPARATYHVLDTLTTAIVTPVADVSIVLTMAMTLGATFEADPAGVRFTGELEAFSASLSGPMGSQTFDEDIPGAYVFVLDPRGGVNVVSVPEFPEPAGSTTPVVSLAHEMFPQLPDRAVQPGDGWVDTVTWSHESPEAVVTTTNVHVYTLVGDTVIDGRTLLHIAISGEAETKGTVGAPGMSAEQAISGAHTGFALWDPERGAMHSMEITRDYSGTMNSPMGEASMKVTGSSRRWLEK